MLRSQQIQRPAHAESRGVGPNGAEPALGATRRQVDVYPRRGAHEALQKARRKNVIGLAVQCALLDVGDLAVERAVVVVVLGKSADTLPRRATGSPRLCGQFIACRKCAAVTVAQRGMHTAG